VGDVRRLGRAGVLGVVLALTVLGCGTTGRLSDRHAVGTRGRAGATSGHEAGGLISTAAARALTLPADCRPHRGDPIQLGVVATFGGSAQVGPAIAVTALSGTICGVATVVSAPPGEPGDPVACVSIRVPADGITLRPPTVEITSVPHLSPVIGGTRVTIDPLLALFCTSAAPGPLVLRTSASVSATAHVFGLSCAVGLSGVPITASVTGPLSAVTINITSGPFAVPGPTSTPSCPSGVTAALDKLVGLPLAPGLATLSLHASGAIYRP
jgi:hypothetical protein